MIGLDRSGSWLDLMIMRVFSDIDDSVLFVVY